MPGTYEARHARPFTCDIQGIIRLADAARWLHDPSGGADPEYTRGQANLICDVSGVPEAGDLISEAVERYITWQSQSGDLAAAIREALILTDPGR